MNATTMTAPETSTRYVGNCQVCARDQKLHNGRLVHHGYKRPGHGNIEGDCMGVDQDPYEVSCDMIKAYKRAVEDHLVHLEGYLVDLEAGKVTSLTRLERVYGGWGRRGHELVEYVAGVTELYQWEGVVRGKVSETKSSISQCRYEIERCAGRIAAWKVRPIRTVEQEVAKADAAKADRKAEKDAARAEREAKKAATKAKQDALAARRAAELAGYKAQLETLAATDPSPARDAAADKLYAQLISKKNAWFYMREVKALGACVVLGLATADGQKNGFGEWWAKYHTTAGVDARY